ncbi:MAG: hypothetical protein HRT74_01170, partial [Flavobacteriales bacterium]|nr:hypothetical protein [Flavobacteriales bacterium]
MKRWIKFIFLSIALAFAIQGQSQMLLPEKAESLDIWWLCSDGFMKRHGIKTMTGSYRQKRSNKPIEDLPGRIQMKFTPLGELNEFENIRSVLGKMDTTYQYFHKDDEGTNAVTIKDGIGYICELTVQEADTSMTYAFRTKEVIKEASGTNMEIESSVYQEKEVILQETPIYRSRQFNELGLPY